MQAELVQERLSRHVQHLLKFGRNTYDPLQYNAVVADINHPFLINAGIACCPCLMDKHVLPTFADLMHRQIPVVCTPSPDTSSQLEIPCSYLPNTVKRQLDLRQSHKPYTKSFTIVATCAMATPGFLLLRSCSGKTTVMALRALYIIGILRQNGGAPDAVVALTFSRRYSTMKISHAVADTSLTVHAQRS